MDNCIENAIEFIKDEKRATVTFSQGRYKSRIRKLAADHPEECRIIAENRDGSLCAHIPVSWVKISPPRAISEDQRLEAGKCLAEYHQNQSSVSTK